MTKSHVAGWDSESPTPAQLKEFFAQIAQGRITKQRFQNFLGKVIHENENIALAILGADIIFPDEITEARGFTYSEDQLKQLANTLPSEDMLRWLKKNNYALMPAPPDPLSLLEIQKLNPNLFYSGFGDWWLNVNLPETTCGWLAIRKEVVPGSKDKNWDEQCCLLGSEEYVPTATEFGWFLTTYYTVRKVRLLENTAACTSSMSSTEIRITMGEFRQRGLTVYSLRPDRFFDYLGIASARKLS